MNFKGTVVNQMITPHNETRFLSDQLKKKQSQQKKCDFSANDSTTISVRSAFALPIRPPKDVYARWGLLRTDLFFRNGGFNGNSKN